MAESEMPREAKVVVIGGGVSGASAAYHLTKSGVRDTILLERSQLSSGTTWHSAGNMETYRDDPLIYDMVQYALGLFPALTAETGQDLGWRQTGRVMFTHLPERMEQFRELPELGRFRGIDLELLTPAEVERRLPIIDPAGLVGGMWVPSDGRVNPTDLTTAFAKGAKLGGARVIEDMPVTRILTREGRVIGVETARGVIGCETVVVAAGLWSAEILKTCGAMIPLYALEHFYVLTKPMNIARDLPLFVSYDDQLYGREDVGGLLIGCLDDNAIPISVKDFPENFSFGLLNERWDQFEPYMLTALKRFPSLASAEVRMLLNGPESFTPDNKMLLGPVPGVSGLFTGCGFNSNGIALSSATGRYLAEWIVEGAPSTDLSNIDVRRFHRSQSAEAFIRPRATEVPGYECRLHRLGDDYTSARGIRRGPLHDVHAAQGARFKSTAGWEQPLWFGDGDGRHHAAVEYAAARAEAIVFDRSCDGKVRVFGEGVSQWLATVSSAAFDGDYHPHVGLVGASGGIEVLAQAVRTGPDAWLLRAGPAQQARLREYLRRAGMPPTIVWRDETSAHCVLDIVGPARADIVATLVERIDHSGGPEYFIGSSPAVIVDAAAAQTTTIIVPTEFAAHVAELLTSRPANAPRWGGDLAYDALRIANGRPAFGTEATPFVPWRESIDPANATTRRLCAYVADFDAPGPAANEPIMAGDRVVGKVTSRARLAGWPSTLVLALVDGGWAESGALETVAGGRRWPLIEREVG